MENMIKVVSVETIEDGSYVTNVHFYTSLKEAVRAADAISDFFTEDVTVFNKDGSRIHY